MKKTLLHVLVALFLMTISSCNGTKNSSDNQSVVVSENQQADSTTSLNQPQTNTDSAQTREAKRANKARNPNEVLTGTQIIERILEKMKNKFSFTDQQLSSCKTILTKKFAELGNDLNKEYTNDEFRTIGHEVLQKSKDEITPLLDESQKAQFVTFVDRK